jgi:hypothetical protein
MADNYRYINTSGVIVPDTSTILEEVQSEYKEAFGEDLVVTPDTPQGVLITAEALSRNETVNNNAALANQINPNIAGGIFLDAIMALTGIQRKPATRTLVSGVTLTGIPGTLISAGAQAQTTAGDLFRLKDGVVIGSGGSVTGVFESTEYGPIDAPVNALNQIVTSVLGWETVINPFAGVLGALQQSDVSARAFRLNTLAFQGVALPVAITSALYNVEGVQSLSFLENYTNNYMGFLASVTDGATLNDTTWVLTNSGEVTIGTTGLSFAASNQELPSPNPWPVAKYTTTGNVALTGLGTQGGGDWPGAMTAADVVLVKNQSSASENGYYTVAAGAWSRRTGYTNGTELLGANQGIAMVPHSIFVCVNGGTDLDVAAALLENKSLGCAWNGNETVEVIEPVSQQVYPVQFSRPVAVPILIRVTITAGDPASIKQAILDYAIGEVEGESGFVVGSDVSPFELASAIGTLYPGTFMTKVEVSYDDPVSYTTDTLAISIDEIATTDIDSITVVSA